MPFSLLFTLGLVAVPAFAIAALVRIDGSRAGNAFRFVAAFLLFAPLVLALRKLVMAPMTMPDMRHYLLGSEEQIPLVAFFFICGLPGLLWRRAPRSGFFIAYLTLGAVLTLLLTAGAIAMRGFLAGLPEILAYAAIAVFLFFWSRRGEGRSNVRSERRKNPLRVESTFRS